MRLQCAARIDALVAQHEELQANYEALRAHAADVEGREAAMQAQFESQRTAQAAKSDAALARQKEKYRKLYGIWRKLSEGKQGVRTRCAIVTWAVAWHTI